MTHQDQPLIKIQTHPWFRGLVIGTLLLLPLFVLGAVNVQSDKVGLENNKLKGQIEKAQQTKSKLSLTLSQFPQIQMAQEFAKRNNMIPGTAGMNVITIPRVFSNSDQAQAKLNKNISVVSDRSLQ